MDFFIRAKKKGKPHQILIYDVIGESFWRDGITAKQIVAALASVEGEDVKVRISCVGGSTMDGTAMYNAFADHDGRVDVVIEGYFCSMGTVVACAGDSVKMYETALGMTHKSSSIAMGNADDFREAADMLDKVDESLAKAYSAKTGLGVEEAKSALMGSKDKWSDPEELKAMGLIDEVIKPKRAIAVLTDKDQASALSGLNVAGAALMDKVLVPSAIRDRLKGLPGVSGFAVTACALEPIMGEVVGGDDSAGGDTPSGDGDDPAGGDSPSGDGDDPAGGDSPSGDGDDPAGGDSPSGDGDDPAGGDSPSGDGDDPVAAERKRVADIMSMAKSNGMSADDDFVKDLIETGASIAQAGQMILAVAQRVNGRQSQSPALGGGDGNGAKGNFGWDKAIGEHNGKRT